MEKTIKELIEQRDKLNESRAKLVAEIDGADEKRFKEIKTEISKIDFKVAELNRNIDEARAKEGAEKDEEEQRAARTPNGTPAGENNPNKVVLFDNNEQRTADADKATMLRAAKSALGKQVRSKIQDLPLNLTATEKRAVGIAITTTSTSYTAPSASTDGVNNGGIFIPQNVLYDLLEMDEVDSPFLRDIKATHITGALIFPYVAESSNGTGKGKKETEKSNDRSIKWDKLTLAQGNYPLTIEVTMELLAMTDEEFADYLLADLGTEVNLLLADEVLYGTGTDNRIAGVTVGATKGTYTAGAEAEAIKAGLLKLSKRARKGAKIYMSREMSLTMTFEKDKEGRYIFPIYNNGGITSIATIPVEVEEGLNDGDFVIGNAKNYKLNFIKPTEIYPELHGKTRTLEYTAHLMVGGKAAPGKFFYGTKSTSQTGGGTGTGGEG